MKNKSKNVDIRYLPGDSVWISGQDRICYIDNVSIRKDDSGKFEVTYEWCNFDHGHDIIEVWDDGYFTNKDIGKIVFDHEIKL